MSRLVGRGPRAAWLCMLSLAVALGLAACASAAATPSATPSQPVDATATVAGPPTPTPYGAHPCSATANVYIANLMRDMAIPTPPNAIISDQGARKWRLNDRTIIYEWVGACSPASTPTALRAFYAARMPAEGWTPTPLLPTLADTHAACAAAAPCWVKSGAAITGADSDEGEPTAEEVTLTNIQTAPAGVEYTVEIVTYYTKS